MSELYERPNRARTPLEERHAMPADPATTLRKSRDHGNNDTPTPAQASKLTQQLLDSFFVNIGFTAVMLGLFPDVELFSLEYFNVVAVLNVFFVLVQNKIEA